MHSVRKLGVLRLFALVALPPYIGLIVLDADAATAGAAGLALLGAVWTLHHSDATARRELTTEYRARWDHPDLLEARSLTADFLADPDKEGRWQEWMTNMDTKKRLQITAILNYWEEVASAYNQDLLDNAWFRTDLAWQLNENWKRAGWFIRKSRRAECNAAICGEWQTACKAVADDLKRQREAGRRAAKEAIDRGDDLLKVPQARF